MSGRGISVGSRVSVESLPPWSGTTASGHTATQASQSLLFDSFSADKHDNEPLVHLPKPLEKNNDQFYLANFPSIFLMHFH